MNEGNAFQIQGIDHVQLAMPAGQEDAARAFYVGILGLAEVPKPPILARRGGVWFERGTLRLHLGVEQDFRPARKAHPAFLVQDLPALVRHLQDRGIAVINDEPLEGYERVYIGDPFGNRIELLEPVAGARKYISNVSIPHVAKDGRMQHVTEVETVRVLASLRD